MHSKKKTDLGVKKSAMGALIESIYSKHVGCLLCWIIPIGTLNQAEELVAVRVW